MTVLEPFRLLAHNDYLFDQFQASSQYVILKREGVEEKARTNKQLDGFFRNSASKSTINLA